jgi:hypothetical protein
MRTKEIFEGKYFFKTLLAICKDLNWIMVVLFLGLFLKYYYYYSYGIIKICCNELEEFGPTLKGQ